MAIPNSANTGLNIDNIKNSHFVFRKTLPYTSKICYIINKKELLDPRGFDGIDGRYRFLPNGIVERKMFVLQLQNKV